jgi:hypothetical protein
MSKFSDRELADLAQIVLEQQGSFQYILNMLNNHDAELPVPLQSLLSRWNKGNYTVGDQGLIAAREEADVRRADLELPENWKDLPDMVRVQIATIGVMVRLITEASKGFNARAEAFGFTGRLSALANQAIKDLSTDL